METSDLLLDAGVDAVLPLGDLQYPCADSARFDRSYDPSWGRLKEITHPVIGNHEYSSAEPGCDSDGSVFFDYFGEAAGDPDEGFYSYDIGEWHVVTLNSNCGEVGGCDAGSPQEQWLRADLTANPTACTLAVWHHPRWASGTRHGSDPSTEALVKALYDFGVEVLLTGHEHNDERFAPQDPDGLTDSTGIRQFVVGTGGKSVNSFSSPLPNSEVRSATFGVLLLTLHPDGYDWRFEPIPGEAFTDSGSSTCHGGGVAPPDTSILAGPDSPTTATTASFTLTSDTEGVTYECSLDGTPFGDCSNQPTFSDLDVGDHVFAARARTRDGLTDPSPATWEWEVVSTGATLTSWPDADATVKAGSPSTNYGSDLLLEADGVPVEEVLLKFSVSGVAQPPIKATLRLFVVDDSSDGPKVYLAGSAWDEGAVTWSNRPDRIGDAVADIGSTPQGRWVEYDVTIAVPGDGTYTFNLVGETSNGADFHSREAGRATEPRLIIELATDREAPDTVIDSGPSSPTNSTDATFAFSANEKA